VTRTPLDLALADLTEPQLTAVNWGDGAMLVLAGPGSGKTRVLTTRVAKILADSPKATFRVLALTFTNKAADEMAARVTALVPDQEKRAIIGTFHSFCMQLLQQHGSHIKIAPDFAIYSLESDRQELMKDALRSAGLPRDDARFLPSIDKLKARLVPSSGCARFFKDPAVGQRIEQAYAAYETALRDANALDFGSLIVEAHRLITQFPGIAARYRKTYANWLFDEFQDTTEGQYRLFRALAGDDFRNVFAVADDDQIIYQWNGASFKQIQRFRTDYKPTELQLPTNYRCPPVIVALANRLVVHNTQRTASKLPLEAGKTTLRYPSEHHVRIVRYSSDDAEAEGIAAGIKSMGKAEWAETAVLARTRASLEKILEALTAAGVSAAIMQRRDDFRSPQFLWLTATLRQALRPMDKRALEALSGAFNRWFGLSSSVDDLITAAELSERSFLDEWCASVKADQSAPEAAKALAELAAKLGKDPAKFRTLIKTALEQFSLDDDIAEDRAAWDDLSRNIAKTIGRDAPLEQFLQELAIRSKEPPTAKNTVSLMTIHGAKGREFVHVYVAGLAEDMLPSFQSLKAGEDSVEMEEERRNCFVAITRAREWLCLSYADTYRGWQKQPSRFLREMAVSLPDAPSA